MNCLEQHKQDEEIQKNKFWKSLTGYQKHMTLMYFYRLLTDAENILKYVETYRFQKMGICPTDLPDFVFYLKPKQLRELAFEQSLSIVPKEEKKVYPNFKGERNEARS